MKISTKGRYALRMMVDLAQHEQNGPVSLRDIARRQQLSDKYLEQIVTPLARAGLVRSVRGAGGGYLLTRKPEEYSVGDILRPVEGDLAPVECATDEGFCEHSCDCVTVELWQDIHRAAEGFGEGKVQVQLAVVLFQLGQGGAVVRQAGLLDGPALLPAVEKLEKQVP